MILLFMNLIWSINTGNDRLFWRNKLREYKSNAAVVMITAYGDIDLAVRSLKEGAADFIVKPWHNEKLISSLKDALNNQGGNKLKLKNPLGEEAILNKELLGDSEVMQEIFYKIEKIAPTDAN